MNTSCPSTERLRDQLNTASSSDASVSIMQKHLESLTQFIQQTRQRHL